MFFMFSRILSMNLMLCRKDQDIKCNARDIENEKQYVCAVNWRYKSIYRSSDLNLFSGKKTSMLIMLIVSFFFFFSLRGRKEKRRPS